VTNIPSFFITPFNDAKINLFFSKKRVCVLFCPFLAAFKKKDFLIEKFGRILGTLFFKNYFF
jgi:hypothetical protein